MSVQYTRGYSVHWGASLTTPGWGCFSTLGDVIEYTGRCSVHWGISLSTPGDVQYTGGYYEYTEGCSVHWGYHDECGDTMSTLRG